MSDTLLERDKVEETTTVINSEGDHDRFRHAFKNEDVANAVFTGKPAKALCGKEDIPMREASKYPVCPTCKEIYDSIPG